MRGFARILTVVVIAASANMARADEVEASQNRIKLAEGKRSISSMRENYAYVMRKEEQARQEHDPVQLNAIHQISTRISDLVNVADHALDDMRVAISSGEPGEAVDAELEKIQLAKTKVDQARNDADRTTGIKLVASAGEEGAQRLFMNEGSNLDGLHDPVAALGNPSLIPTIPTRPPPASRTQ